MEQAQISSMSGPDLEPRRDICSGDAFLSSMRLDQIITSCLFAMVQRACGDEAEDSEFFGLNFAYELDTFKFRLPTVRFNYE